jgi:hypothetical protein
MARQTGGVRNVIASIAKQSSVVIPAKAGISWDCSEVVDREIPACAGMTKEVDRHVTSFLVMTSNRRVK